MNKLKGIHLSHDKDTENCASVDFPLPKSVIIPMSQSMGATCSPLVKADDTVTVDRKLATPRLLCLLRFTHRFPKGNSCF
jgi:electron transport complex protein RnfC